MADEGGASAALIDMDQSERRRLQRARLTQDRRRRGITALALGALALGLLAGGFAWFRLKS